MLLALLGCGKEGCNIIPDAKVNISISQGSTLNLSAHGNYDYFFDQGYAGVVLINNNGRVYAFDLCSTINPTNRNPVTVVDNAYFFDRESGAKWLLDGSPAAVAECPLKGYAVTTSNNGFTYNVRY
ncbi:hypothetical protein [Sphingobacterium rhinopitheci]|uniref:hypothetical protein n=1 Tax=Sphingobacterium rhinopitheci TaxID=2781960 RepID=UPI001F51A0F3|nr:hypothetical protein [Sphingobacterium rhinopitheci]MCI0920519.1 hypothetical protein [Sphingobacterium rhinopitheci]